MNRLFLTLIILTAFTMSGCASNKSTSQPINPLNEAGGEEQSTIQERIQNMRSLGIPDNQIEEALIRTGQIKTNADFKKLVETIPVSPTPQPSERSLKAASYAYANASKEEQKKYISLYAEGQYKDITDNKGTPYKQDAQGNTYTPDLKFKLNAPGTGWEENTAIGTVVINSFALALDSDLAWLIQWETWVEIDKVAKSRPVYVQQQAPSVDIRCTSNFNYSGTSIDTTCR